MQSSQEPLQPQLSTSNGDRVARTPGAVAARSGGTKARSFALVQRSQELERLELPSPDDEEEKSSNNCFAALANHSFVLFGMTLGALQEMGDCWSSWTRFGHGDGKPTELNRENPGGFWVGC